MAAGQGPQPTAVTTGLGLRRMAVQPKGITARQWAQSVEHKVNIIFNSSSVLYSKIVCGKNLAHSPRSYDTRSAY